MGDFYGTGIEIWAGFGRLALLKKKIGADYEQRLRSFFSPWFFSCFHWQKIFFFLEKLRKCFKLSKLFIG